MEEITQSEKKKKRKRRLWFLLLLLLVLSFGGCTGWRYFKQQSIRTGGITITGQKDKTIEEIQEELDKQVRDSMMTITLDVTPTLTKDGERLYVRAENVKDNPFAQLIEVTQDEKLIGSYKGLKPGKTLEYLPVSDCHTGKAFITVTALDESGLVSGNPSQFEVTIVKK